MKTVSIYFIGTSKYIDFFPEYYERHSKYFLSGIKKNFLVFTDQPEHSYFNKENVKSFKIEHEPWPFVTLNRFKHISRYREDYPSADWHFFIDADLWPNTDIRSEDLIDPHKPYLGVQHPGFMNGAMGSFEKNPASAASITDKPYDLSIYRQGCLWGGRDPHFFKLIDDCYKAVEQDNSNKVVAAWHDESHLNYFFLNNAESTHTAPASFAAPQAVGPWTDQLKHLPVHMLHLSKDNNTFPRFEGGVIN